MLLKTITTDRLQLLGALLSRMLGLSHIQEQREDYVVLGVQPKIHDREFRVEVGHMDISVGNI